MAPDAESLLKSLKFGENIEELSDELEIYLSPVQGGNLTAKECISYSVFTVKFLCASISHLMSAGLSKELLIAIVNCYSHYKNLQSHGKLDESLTVSKCLYHLLAKLSEKTEYMSYTITVARNLHTELKDLAAKKDATVIVSNAYSILWNLAAKEELKADFAHSLLTLNLRHLALKILLLKPNGLLKVGIKINIAFLRFQKLKNTLNRLKNPHSLILLSQFDIWEDLLQTIMQIFSGNMSDNLCSVVDVCVQLARYIAQYCLGQEFSSLLETTKNFIILNSEKDKDFLNSIFVICEATIGLKGFETEDAEKNITKITTLFASLNTANENLKSSLKKRSSVFHYLPLCIEVYQFFLEQLQVLEFFCLNKLSTAILEVVISLVDAQICMLKMKDSSFRSDNERTTYKYLLVGFALQLEVYSILLKQEKIDSFESHLKASLEAAKDCTMYISMKSGLSISKTNYCNLSICGYSMIKLGHLCYSQNFHRQAIDFYQLAIPWFWLWCTSDFTKKQQMMLEVPFIKIHEYLAESQKRCNEWQAALDTAIACLQYGPESISIAVKIWLRIKQDICKDQPDLIHKNLRTILLEKEKTGVLSTSNIDLVSVLHQEWETLKKSRRFGVESEHKVLTELIDLTEDPTKRACLLLELAQLQWIASLHGARSGKECLWETIRLLEENSQESSETLCLLAQAYQLLYIYKQEEDCQLIATNVEGPGEKNCDAVVFTIHAELPAMELLDKAMEFWEEGITDDYLKQCTNIESLLQYLLLCGSIYSASRKLLPSVRALSLALSISKKYGNADMRNTVVCRVAEGLLSADCYMEAKDLLEEESSSVNVHGPEYLVRQLRLVEVLMAEGQQISQCLQMVKKVMESEVLQLNKTKSSYFAQAIGKLLLSRLLMASADCPTKPWSKESPLDLAYNAVQLHTHITHCIIGKSIISAGVPFHEAGPNREDLFDRWKVLNELLQSLLYLGQLYCHVGDERECKCYLKEGLRLSEGMGLPRWTAEFQLAIAQICLLAEKLHDAKMAIRKAEMILTFPDDISLLQSNQSNRIPSSESPHSAQTPERHQNGHLFVETPDPFGFIEGSPFNQGLEEKNSRRFEGLNVCGEKVDMAANLECSTFIIHEPESLYHVQFCLCSRCEDLLAMYLYRCCVAMAGDLQYMLGNFREAGSLLLKMEQQQAQLKSHLETNLAHALDRLQRSLDSKKKTKIRKFNFLIQCPQSFLKSSLIHAKISQQERDFVKVMEHVKNGSSIACSVRVWNVPEMLVIKTELYVCQVSAHQNIFKLTSNKSSAHKVTTDFDKIGIHAAPNITPEIVSLKGFSKEKEKIMELSGEKCTKKCVTKRKTRKKATQHSSPHDDNGDAAFGQKEQENRVLLKNVKEVKTVKPQNANNDDKEFQLSVKTLQSKQLSAVIPKNVLKDRSNNANDNLEKSLPPAKRSLIDEFEDKSIKTLSKLVSEKPQSAKTPGAGKKTKTKTTRANVLSKSVNHIGIVDQEIETKRECDSIVETTQPFTDAVSGFDDDVAEKTTRTADNYHEKYSVVKREDKCEAASSKTSGKTRGRPRKVDKSTLSQAKDGLTNSVAKAVGESQSKNCVGSSPVQKLQKKRLPQAETRECEEKSLKTLKSAKSKANTRQSNTKNSKNLHSEVGIKQSSQSVADVYIFDEIDVENKTASKSKRRLRTVNQKSLGQFLKKSEPKERKRGEEIIPGKVFNVSPVRLLEPSDTVDEGFTPIRQSGSPVKCFQKLVGADDMEENSLDYSAMFSGQTEIVRAVSDDEGSEKESNYWKTEWREKRITADYSKVKVVEHLPDGSSKAQEFSTADDIPMVLERAYKQLQHFPSSPLHSTVCKLLCLEHLPFSSSKSAFYLHEAQALTFRHSMIALLNKKIRKLKKKSTPKLHQDVRQDIAENPCYTAESPSEDGEKLVQAWHTLQFGKQASDFQNMINCLPPEWSVCQVSVVSCPPHTGCKSQLLVTQYCCNCEPLVLPLQGYGSVQGREVHNLFVSILGSHLYTLRQSDVNEWWRNRRKLNNQMEDLVDSMEKYWLGCWKGVMQGKLVSDKDCRKLEDYAAKVRDVAALLGVDGANSRLLQILIDSAEILSDNHLSQAVEEATGLKANSLDHTTIQKTIVMFSKKLNSCMANRHPLILILDKDVQMFPWESIPILRNHSVTRLPSLYHLVVQKQLLHNHSNSVWISHIDPSKTYYVLNPDANLPSTQKCFQAWFENEKYPQFYSVQSCWHEKGWEGVVAETPTSEQYITALTKKDLMIYCGHGSGNKYLHGDHLQQLNCRATVLLMGCSSGRLEAKGKLEPVGMVSNYFLAGCPCVVANLWDVTDKDIDRFLEALLKSWLSGAGHSSLLEAVVKAREACKLSYLIGCAPVVYGFPVTTTPTEQFTPKSTSGS